MAIMPGVRFINRSGEGAFASPYPVGCVLHRTEQPHFAHSANSFLTVGKYPHFLVGKDGEILQVTDTSKKATHVGPANKYYIGIETSSIAARHGYEKKQDPRTIRDALTLAQGASLRRVVDWVASTHSIPKIGPPSSKEMKDVSGIWHGFCNHADVEKVIHSAGHLEGFTDPEFMTMGVWPSGSRNGESSMTETLRDLDRKEMTPAERAKDDALNQFLKKLGKQITP